MRDYLYATAAIIVAAGIVTGLLLIIHATANIARILS